MGGVDAPVRVGGDVAGVRSREVLGQLPIEVVLAVLGRDVKWLDVELDPGHVRIGADLARHFVRETGGKSWAQLVEALHVAVAVGAPVDDRGDDQRSGPGDVERLVVGVGAVPSPAARCVVGVQVARGALRAVVVRAVHLQISRVAVDLVQLLPRCRLVVVVLDRADPHTGVLVS